ncbi:hypothetical protein EON65_46195 [archaeon]|nr:MAG: hypothetical protein EON65_46195 [archaeon]
MMTALIPCFGALVIASLTILISNSLADYAQKTLFQFAVFGGLFSASVAYLVFSSDAGLMAFWQTFQQLSLELRFVLALAVITATYFGAAMYLAAPVSEPSSGLSSSLASPASSDNNVTFDIPTDMPASDVHFFEQFLPK